LNGTGVAPAGVSLSPVGGVTFGTTGVGLTSAAQTLTLTNNSGAAITIQNIVTSGDFAVVTGGSTCGGSVAAGSACTMQVVFAPTAAGTRTGSLTVINSGVAQTLTLSGIGVDYTLEPDGPVTLTIPAGASATYALLLRGAAGLPGLATMKCTGAPAYATCTVSPGAPGIAGTTLMTVTIATSSADLHMPARPGERRNEVWLAGLLPIGLLCLSRARLRGCIALIILCGVTALIGCSVARLIPATGLGDAVSGGGPTPKGTYNLTVSGSSAGLTRSVGLTLVVQ